MKRQGSVLGEGGTGIGHEVVALRSWELDGRERMRGGPGVVPAETAAEAVAAALAAL